MSITPDTKDWTWVLERPCPECGFESAAREVSDLPDLLGTTTTAWTQVLARRDVADRPRPGVWSPLEYACHVRDVHVLFAERVRLMLAEDVPTFALICTANFSIAANRSLSSCTSFAMLTI